MTTGLDNGDESGGERADAFVAQLLYGQGAADTAALSSAPPQIHPAGAHWAYSTGTSAIVSDIVGRSIGPDVASRSPFIRTSLFEPIGMRSAAFGFDRC